MSTTPAPAATVTNTYKQTSIYQHMDLMENIIDDAPGVYKFKIINADEFLDILDKSRARLPEELRDADEILQRRDHILGEAQRRAEQIVGQARRQSEQMLQESELLKAVQAEVERIRKQVVSEIEQMRREALSEAERIRAEAEEDANRVKNGADHYAESMLTRVDSDLAQIAKNIQESQTIVRNGQRLLGQINMAPPKDASSQLMSQAGHASNNAPPAGYSQPVHTQLSSPLLSRGE